MPLVTIDFHNTLFRCDEWFLLEIESLPATVLRQIAHSEYSRHQDEIERAAGTRYRDIRFEAMQTGRECDAVTGVCRTFDYLGLKVERDQVDQAVEQIMQQAVNGAHPIVGAAELVESLRDRDIQLAVISSAAYHPFLEWCLERFNLRSPFEHIVTSASCGIYKSDPGIYTYTLELFDADPAQSVHIGDSHRFDVASAASVGMKTILFTSEGGRGLTPQPDAIVRTLGEAGHQLDRLLPSRILD